MSTQPVLFDTHLHVEEHTDTRALFDDARGAGVTGFLVVGTTLASSTRAARLAASSEGVVAAAGLHPHEARHFAGLDPFRELLQTPSVVAVGEIGLDYHYDHSPRDMQQEAFSAFLRLAGELGLASVIHCREAFDDCFRIVRDCLLPGQQIEFHSFTGTPIQAEAILDLGGMISVNGMVTFKRADNIRDMLAVVPLDRLLLETDAPYLAPVPHRGGTNVPAFLPRIAARVAEEKGVSPEHVAEVTTANARRFFGLD